MFRGIKFVPADTKIDFVSQRAISWFVSAFLTVVPLILVTTIGLNMGIDFQGGTLIEVQTKENPADLAGIRSKISDLGLGEVQIQEFGAPDEVLIRIASQPTEEEQQASIAKVKEALGDTVTYRRTEIVGPTIFLGADRGRHAGRRRRDDRYHDLRVVPVRMAVRGRRGRLTGCMTSLPRSVFTR